MHYLYPEIEIKSSRMQHSLDTFYDSFVVSFCFVGLLRAVRNTCFMFDLAKYSLNAQLMYSPPLLLLNFTMAFLVIHKLFAFNFLKHSKTSPFFFM